ncbi:flavodoxin family protein [Bacillus sp. DJP31]|uniref:flavodoxin family protein n=1 Tax=Bacillus sp. DJP31 TaxID=3409789 RepID=UPI003BB67D14
MSIILLQGSSRENGNTEILSKLLVEGLTYKQINLRDFSIKPILDQRHDEGGFQAVDDDYDEIIMEVLKADRIIFATPLYWYGMSGLMKNFVDRWSQSLRDSRFQFKEEMSRKKAIVVVCGGDDPKIKGLPLIQQFQYIFDFVQMPFEDYVIGKGGRPGDVLHDEIALQKACQVNLSFRNNK